MKNTIIYMVCLALVLLGVAGCGKPRERQKGKDETVPVRVAEVRAMDVNKTLDYVGNIKGQDEAIVYPKISGKIIDKVKEEGDMVKKGEAIAYIDRDEVGLKFEKAPVESPLSGTVGRIYIDIGSSVTPQTSIALVADTSKAEIYLEIPEKYLPNVEIGQDAEIRVDSQPEEIFMGRVTMVSPVVDLKTRTAPIEITIDNTKHLLQSGMFAKVSLILQRNKNVPVIIKEAIVGRAPDTYVYTVSENKANLRKVKLGIRQGSCYEVRDGLRVGDRVVIMGQQRLKDGALVAAEE